MVAPPLVTSIKVNDAFVGQEKNNEPPQVIIKDVWADNLEEEFTKLRRLIKKYPYVAMDTEFPGFVARPLGNFKSHSDYQFQTLRCNVDLLKVIQVGITVADEQGNIPSETSAWQFNFKFNLNDDMYAQESIDLLTHSGIDFKKHETKGINVIDFGELLTVSGIVLSEDVKWISFHSGYDFGYLLKVLTLNPMPIDETNFFSMLKIFFPSIYDIKFLMKSCKTLKGGLQDVADELGVIRIGPQHQAGSDALLTCLTFFKMKQVFFNDEIDDELYMGHLYGLGVGAVGAGTGGAAQQTINVTVTSSVDGSLIGEK